MYFSVPRVIIHKLQLDVHLVPQILYKQSYKSSEWEYLTNQLCASQLSSVKNKQNQINCFWRKAGMIQRQCSAVICKVKDYKTEMLV